MNSFSLHNNPRRKYLIITPILQVRQIRLCKTFSKVGLNLTENREPLEDCQTEDRIRSKELFCVSNGYYTRAKQNDMQQSQ